MKYLDKSVAYIDSLLGDKSPRHFERTVHWLKVLNPDADEALLVAAYSHDIERFFREGNTVVMKRFPNETELTIHQEQGGKLMEKFLLENGASTDFAERVKHLISKHEVGGDSEQNLLKDADSISYFEVNAPKHIVWIEEGFPKAEIIKKFEWMYKRISLKKAQELSQPFYKQALDLV